MGKFGERNRRDDGGGLVDCQFVESAADVLYEGSVALLIDRRAESLPGYLSDRLGKLGERDRGAERDGLVRGQFVEAAADVLHQRMSGDHGSGADVGLKAAHRTEALFEPAVVGLDPIVAVPSVLCCAAGISSSSTAG